ncbi:MAG: HAD family hydrolase [Treponema sp.]|jgi:putative hydrolase of the HAD superfamily|nr:HAD family hydrolase [Treponema sp.]
MRNDIDGVAFDLDGTLYPNYRLNLRLIPFILREFPLLLAQGKARDLLRGKRPLPKALEPAAAADFYDVQARYMAFFLKKEPAFIKMRMEELIYRGWEPLFRKIKPFPHVRETLRSIRDGGFRLGLLSDFPPEKKLEYMGLGGLWEVVCCSERIGRLKPAAEPFAELARRMGVRPERLLYVGNSLRYDILGARQAGMQTALICSPLPGKRRSRADFVFHDYRQLGKYVLS